MHLSAVKIAEKILQKTAVSRWREAIYSGELPLEQREQLKAHMGATPEKYLAGLEKHRDMQMSKGTGVSTPFKTLKEDVKGMLQGTRSMEDFQQNLPDLYRGTFMGSHSAGGNITHVPPVDRVNFSKILWGNKEAPLLERAGTIKDLWSKPRTQREFDALVLRHELGEATTKPMRSARAGLFQIRGKKDVGKMPLNRKPAVAASGFTLGAMNPSVLQNPVVAKSVQGSMRAQLSPGGRGQHMSPAVLMDELRTSRMMSPELQRIQAMTRSQTGEFGNVKDLKSLRVSNPKSSAGRQMMEGMQSQADAGYAPLDDYIQKWMSRGKAARPIMDKVFSRVKQLLG